jgi:hypothetical protein
MNRPLALALAFSLVSALGALGQDQSAVAADQPPRSPYESRSALAPTPGVDGENPLGRLAIVTLGSFPILLFYTDFSFDLGKFVFKGFDANYAPWPFKSEYSEPPSVGEKAARIGVAIGASAAVGAIDYFIRSSRAKKARLQREALLELSAEERDAVAAPAPTPAPAPAPAPTLSPAPAPADGAPSGGP